MNDKKPAILITATSAFIAGLCCFYPLVIFLLGLASASFASSVSETLYHQYKWYFRASGLVFLGLAFGIWYYKRSRACSLDAKQRLRRKFINLFLLSVLGFIFFYVVWLYGIVEFVGIWVGIWSLPPYFESILNWIQ